MLNLIKKEWNTISDDYKKKIKEKGIASNIPNIITLSRLIGFLFLIQYNLSLGNIQLAGIIATIGFATDGIDGFIARKFNYTTKLGAHLDAITDKFFTLSLIGLTIKLNPLIALVAPLEIAIGSMMTQFKLKGKDASTNITGKLKSGFLYSLVASSFFLSNPLMLKISQTLLITTLPMQVMTLTKYYKTYKNNDKNNNDKDDNNTKNNLQDEEKNNEKSITLSSNNIKQFKVKEVQEISTESLKEFSLFIASLEEYNKNSAHTYKKI